MSKGYDIFLRVRLQNGASEGVKRLHREQQQEARKTAQSYQGINHSWKQVYQTGGQLTRQSETLRRAQRAATQEVQGSTRAIDTLTRSSRQLERQQNTLGGRTYGVVRSLRELVNMRAPHALISGVQKLSGAMRGLQGLQGVAAGVAAGGYVLSRPVSRTMDYSMGLANLANVAYADSGLAGRKAGKKELDTAIRTATRTGGGTRESAVDALNSLISQGMDRGDAMKLLPKIMRTSTAAGADSSDISNLVMKAGSSGGINAEQIGNFLDMALTSGQLGGFELKDMARWLPNQMGKGSSFGFKGMDDLNVLLAANQAAITTAGSADEAGNNVANLLAKITSTDTSLDAKKLGIDLAGTLSAARGKGMDPLTAFVNLAKKTTDADPRFRKLTEQARTANDTDRAAIYQQQADIFQGTALGGLIQDRQAASALIAIMGQQGVMRDQITKTRNSQGAVDTNFSLIADESGFKVQQAANEKSFAEADAFAGLAETAGNVAQALADVAAEHPKLAAATVTATTALTALTAAAAAGSVAGLLTGGKGGAAAGAARTLGKRLGIGAIMAGAMPATSLATAGLAGAATVAGGVLAAGGAGYAVGSGLYAWQGSNMLDLITKGLAALGSENAKQQIQVNVSLDGQQVAAAVNANNSRDSSRQ